MKIVITSTGNDLDSEIDQRFARAKNFIVYDTENDEFEVVDNSQNLNASHGAGPQAVLNISNLQAEYVITGHCGPNAFRTLEAAGIKVIVGQKGTVGEVIKQFKDGVLKPTDSPDTQRHWS